MPSLPVVLTIAGSDCSAGAGVQADLKTIAAHGLYGVSAITAIVAESPGVVSAVSPIKSTLLQSQIKRVTESFSLSGIKIGMLATEDNTRAVSESLKNVSSLPFVIDPVFHASAGAELLEPSALAPLIADLLPLATLVTPNRSEAEALLGASVLTDGIDDAALSLSRTLGTSVLLKGGHIDIDSSKVTDVLATNGELHHFTRPRLNLPDLHGTGCTLSSAITSSLALGRPLKESVESGIAYLESTMTAHLSWPMHPENRALNHFPDRVESGES